MEIAEMEDRLLAALRSSNGQWVKRSQIAKQLGRNKLQPGDVVMLEVLVERGLAESRRVDTYAPSKYRVEYRSITK
jgi:hypothetical protein